MTSMYNRHSGVTLLYTYLIIIKSCVKTYQCNESPMKIRHDRRCWAADFALNMTGITRHDCILTCKIRKDCHFVNYHFREGRCQLGSVCRALQWVPEEDAIIFEEVDVLNECMKWIPAKQFGDNKGFRCKHTETGYVSRLITDTYIIPGSTLYPDFKGAYYNGSGGPSMVETTDIERVDFLQEGPGCRLSWHIYLPSNPEPHSAAPGGFVRMDDGAAASLYVACVDSLGWKHGYYKSVTKKAYYVNDNVANVTSIIRLLLARPNWTSIRHPFRPL